MFNLEEFLLNKWNALLCVSVWVGIQTAKRMLPDEYFDKGRLLARLLPIAPIAICCAAVWVPGPWATGEETAAQLLILGVVLGAVTSNIHTIASRLGVHQILGVESDTRKIADKRKRTSKKVDESDIPTRPDNTPVPE